MPFTAHLLFALLLGCLPLGILLRRKNLAQFVIVFVGMLLHVGHAVALLFASPFVDLSLRFGQFEIGLVEPLALLGGEREVARLTVGHALCSLLDALGASLVAILCGLLLRRRALRHHCNNGCCDQ